MEKWQYPYSNYKVYTNADVAGAVYYCSKSIEITDNNFGQSAPVKKTVKRGESVRIHGDYYIGSNGTSYYLLQTGSGLIIWLNMNFYVNHFTTNSSSDALTAQNYLSDILAYHRSIQNNNLLCARMIKYSAANNIKIPDALVTRLGDLQNNLQERDAEIRKSGVSFDVSKTELSAYENDLKTILASPQSYISAIPLLAVWITVAVLAVIGTSITVSWAFFKTKYLSAKSDFQFSNGLVADLKKYLPEKVFNQLMAENEQNASVASAAIKQAESSTLGSTLKNIGVLAAGVGIFFLAKPILKQFSGD